jgi:hypothetical protein
MKHGVLCGFAARCAERPGLSGIGFSCYFEAPPRDSRGAASPIRKELIGQAKPDRTSGGKAAKGRI